MVVPPNYRFARQQEDQTPCEDKDGLLAMPLTRTIKRAHVPKALPDCRLYFGGSTEKRSEKLGSAP